MMFKDDMPLTELLELQDLLDILNEEGLNKEQDARLQEIVAKYASARQYYLQTMFFFGQLRWQAAQQEKDETSRTPPAPTSIFGLLGETWRKGHDFLSHDTPFALFLVLIFAGLSLMGVYWFVNSFDRPSAGPVYVAQITGTKDCQWSKTMTPPAQMMQLQAGQHLQLEKGIAHITYANGALVVLEGPVSFTVETANSGFISRGKLSARADSEQSRYFTIASTDARFVDLGTEFGVMIDEKGRAAVAVFEGKVNAAARLANGRWDAPVPIIAGEAVVCVERKFSSYVAQRTNFPTLQALPPPPPSPGAPYERWLEASRELQKRQDLLAYYDFQPDADDRSLLINRAPTGAAIDGRILDAPWVDGRFPGKSALDFTAGGAGARINLPGEYRQLTLIAWLCGNTSKNDRSGILMSDDWKRSKELHWQIMKNGQVELCIFGQWEPNFSALAIPAESLKQWCMLAAVIDTDANLHRLYFNGEFFDEIKSSNMPPANIGPATIGGWNNQGKGDAASNSTHNLSGRMDEFMIFKGALSAEEIKQIYESGKP
jgi:Concanavalin A-like lectin/glucanases superfamily